MATPAPAKEQMLEDYENEPEHTCFHCGRKGREMIPDSQGHHYCIDRVLCWKRWDEQHGLRGFTLG